MPDICSIVHRLVDILWTVSRSIILLLPFIYSNVFLFIGRFKNDSSHPFRRASPTGSFIRSHPYRISSPTWPTKTATDRFFPFEQQICPPPIPPRLSRGQGKSVEKSERDDKPFQAFSLAPNEYSSKFLSANSSGFVSA